MFGVNEKPRYKPPAWCVLKECGRCYLWEDFRDSEKVYQMVFYDKHCEKCLHLIAGKKKENIRHSGK